MLKKAAIVAVAFAGQAYVEAVAIQKREGAHGHHPANSAAAAPSSGYSAPAPSYGAPADSYGAPTQSYSAPAQSYSAPAPSYGAPAPAPAYGAPAESYGAPAESYGAPATGYGAPATGYGPDEGDVAGPNLLPIIIGILAVLGLSLLFPTFVSLTSVRRKRSAAEASNPMYDMYDRVNDIYGSVLASESCMERIACELGGMVKDMTASPVAGYVEPFVPSKYKGYYKQFKSGASCDKIKCGGY